jgi:hypothetical protein
LKRPLTSLEARALAFAVLNEKDLGHIEIKDAKAFTYKVSRKDLNRRLFNWEALLAFPGSELTRAGNPRWKHTWNKNAHYYAEGYR